MSSFSVTNAIILRHTHPVFGYESCLRATEEPPLKGAWKRNLAKVAGAFPIIGGIPVGAVNFFNGNEMRKKSTTPDERAKGITFMVRGGGEVFLLGPVWLVIDVSKTIFDHLILPLTRWICRIAKKLHAGEKLGIDDFLPSKIVDFKAWVIEKINEH